MIEFQCSMNWNQTGMPSALVDRLGQRREFSEYKTVLNSAQSHVLHPVDVESMAQELVQSGGRELVEMVRDLTMELEATKKELEEANRRYERLTADLRRRGVSLEENVQPSSPETPSPRQPKSPLDGAAEWEEWDRRFRELLG